MSDFFCRCYIFSGVKFLAGVKFLYMLNFCTCQFFCMYKNICFKFDIGKFFYKWMSIKYFFRFIEKSHFSFTATFFVKIFIRCSTTDLKPCCLMAHWLSGKIDAGNSLLFFIFYLKIFTNTFSIQLIFRIYNFFKLFILNILKIGSCTSWHGT